MFLYTKILETTIFFSLSSVYILIQEKSRVGKIISLWG